MKHARPDTRFRLALWCTLFVIFLLLVCGAISFGVTQAKAEEQRQAEAAKAIEEERRAWIASEALSHQKQKDQWANVMVQLDILKAADEQRRIEAEEAAYQEWLWQQSQYWYEPQTYSEPAEMGSDGSMTWQEFQWQGVVYDDEGHLYTYYSERVLPGSGLTELNENGRHSEDGFVKDGDGYIAVASRSHEKGEVVDTPFGKGKVYDTGYLQDGQIDVYVSF